MTLQEIANLFHAEYGNRYQITPAQALRYMNIVQQIAFDKDLEAFKDYSNTLTILQQIEFVSSGYTSAVDGDVGLAVVGADSAATGTLRYYNNTTRKWAVETSDTFTDGEAITITSGTGAGTLAAASAQSVYKGPYDFPTSPLVRKMIGVTKLTDAQLYGVPPISGQADDYGLITQANLDKMYERHRLSVRGSTRTLEFIEVPSTTAVYRWVYYVRPPTIESFATAQDVNLWIQPEHHWLAFYQAMVALADNATYGDKQPHQLLVPYLEPWWDMQMRLQTPMGGYFDYGISEGQP